MHTLPGTTVSQNKYKATLGPVFVALARCPDSVLNLELNQDVCVLLHHQTRSYKKQDY